MRFNIRWDFWTKLYVLGAFFFVYLIGDGIFTRVGLALLITYLIAMIPLIMKGRSDLKKTKELQKYFTKRKEDEG